MRLPKSPNVFSAMTKNAPQAAAQIAANVVDGTVDGNPNLAQEAIEIFNESILGSDPAAQGQFIGTVANTSESLATALAHDFIQNSNTTTANDQDASSADANDSGTPEAIDGTQEIKRSFFQPC